MPNFTKKTEYTKKFTPPEHQEDIPELTERYRKTRILKRDGKILIDIRKMHDDKFTEKGICLPFDFIEKLVDIFPQIQKRKREIEGS